MYSSYFIAKNKKVTALLKQSVFYWLTLYNDHVRSQAIEHTSLVPIPHIYSLIYSAFLSVSKYKKTSECDRNPLLLNYDVPAFLGNTRSRGFTEDPTLSWPP